MNNKELARKIRELIAWQNKSACGFSFCSDCDCWNEEFECLNNGCSILIQAADALEKASDYEKVLADFAKVVNAGFQAMAEQKEKA